MKKKKRLFWTLLIIGILAVIGITSWVVINREFFPFPQRLENGLWVKTTVISKTKPTTNSENQIVAYQIEIMHPIFSGPGDQKIIRGINKLVEDCRISSLDTFLSNLSSSEISPLNTLDSEFEVFSATENYLSFTIKDYVFFAGSAHGQYWYFPCNYDLRTGKPLLLSDLFKPNTPYLKTIANYCRARLLESEIGENPDWVEKGTKPTLDNYTVWNLGKKSLIITFPSYQVACWAAGPQTVAIPFDKLTKVLNTNGIIKTRSH